MFIFKLFGSFAVLYIFVLNYAAVEDEDGKTGADACWVVELLLLALAMKSGVMHAVPWFTGLDELAVECDVLDVSVSNALFPGNRVAYDGGGSISS